MSSKDKLIEFLKSANIEYEVSETKDGIWIELNHTSYLFGWDGEYEYMENY